jgi:hypothetical protein
MTVRDILLAADQKARNEAIRLESTGQLPPQFVEKHYGLSPIEQHELRRLKASAAIADDADTYVALARGHDLPRAWYKRRLRDLMR